MTRKSAARRKPIKPQHAEEQTYTLEETWENAKEVITMTAKVALENSKRIDNMLNVRDLLYKFWGNKLDDFFDLDKRMEYLHEMHHYSISLYEQVLEIVESFELEEFLKDDMKDYFKDMMPDCDAIDNENDLVRGALAFLTVKPWGEQMNQLHQTMLNEKSMREMNEG